MREQFRKELRGRLMSEAVVVLAHRPSRFSFPALLRPALAAAAVLVLVLAGATSAAGSSLPGDALFSLKRATEDLRVALTFDDVARLQFLSDLADRRLEELAEVTQHRASAAPTATAEFTAAVERLAAAVDKLRDETDSKRDAAEAVAEAARQKHVVVLDSLKDKVSDDARPGIDRLIQRENERDHGGPSVSPRGNDDEKGDGNDGVKPTAKPENPTPGRATPRATPRPTPTPKSTERDHD